MAFTVEGISIVSKLVQFEKAPFPRIVRICDDDVIDFDGDIDVDVVVVVVIVVDDDDDDDDEDANRRFFREEHLEKAPSPIDVRDAGSNTLSKEEQPRNASSPIDWRHDENLTLLNRSQCWNVRLAMRVTEFSNTA